MGLKDYAIPSEDEKLAAGKFYRDLQPASGKAQRARKKARVRAIHARIRNRRKDALHKFSTARVNSHAAIFVGDVSSKKRVKTRMAKSVQDAGWLMLKTQAIARSVVFEVVNERYSTRLVRVAELSPPAVRKVEQACE
ncbi:transposase [Scandinavium goeteborgense]|uniref:transposase n=1 Tax=Scandinavium goeteborgense TaxID=1851514 RepID=UPI0020008521|nr:transposase [Scandinavium goeteborgense]